MPRPAGEAHVSHKLRGMMDISEIKRKLEESIAELQSKDKFLLENDVSERSITHRMALFLTHQFPD